MIITRPEKKKPRGVFSTDRANCVRELANPQRPICVCVFGPFYKGRGASNPQVDSWISPNL